LFLFTGLFFCLMAGFMSSLPVSIGVPYALQHIPGTFTFGEISVVFEGILLFVFTAVTNISNKMSDDHFDSMEKISLILQVFKALLKCNIMFKLNLFKKFQTAFLGLAVICILVTALPGLRKIRLILALIVGIMGGAVLPALFIIFRENPILWILHFITDDKQRVSLYRNLANLINVYFQVYLLVYWFICCFFAICAVRVQVQNHQQASTSVRKIFHVLIVAVYLPGLAWECTLLYLSSGVALAFLILVEVRNVSKINVRFKFCIYFSFR